MGPTEIGAFGISSADDLLLVTDLCLVRQECDWASVKFDDAAVADYFDEQVAAGRKPEEFARVWIHTHPGHSPQPSGTDEATFCRVFGRCDWAVMAILACGGKSYARVRFAAGPGASVKIPIEVELGGEFQGTDRNAWEAEYRQCIRLPDPADDPRDVASLISEEPRHPWEGWRGGPWGDDFF